MGLKRCLFYREDHDLHPTEIGTCPAKSCYVKIGPKYNVSCTISSSGMGRGSEPFYDNVFLAMKHADIQPNYLNAMTDHVHGTQNELITFTSHEWVHSPMGFWHDMVAIGSLLSRFCQTCFISPLPFKAITCDNTYSDIMVTIVFSTTTMLIMILRFQGFPKFSYNGNRNGSWPLMCLKLGPGGVA